MTQFEKKGDINEFLIGKPGFLEWPFWREELACTLECLEGKSQMYFTWVYFKTLMTVINTGLVPLTYAFNLVSYQNDFSKSLNYCLKCFWLLILFFYFFLIFIFTLFYFTILYWFCHTFTWIHHGWLLLLYSSTVD